MVSKHNLHFLLNMMREFQASIEDGSTEEYVTGFLKEWYGAKKELPDWVELGLDLAGFSKDNIF